MIIRSIIKTLAQLISTTNTLAKGDLNVEIDTSYNDELSILAKSYQSMVDGLKEKVKLAEQIGKGDVDISVNLASEADILGLSLQHMADSLKAKVKLTEQISLGDLSVEVPLTSDSDTLGKALQNMVENLNNLLSQAIVGNCLEISEKI